MPDQKSFQDKEFNTPSHLSYSQVKLKRYPLSELRKMDPSFLKPSRLTKQLKSLFLFYLILNLIEKSALLTSLTSIVYKEKESFKNIFYPQMPLSKIPLYNPYGRYIIKLFINGEYKAVNIDDFIIQSSNGPSSSTSFSNELDFYFCLVNKALQKVNLYSRKFFTSKKLKHLGIKIDKDPAIYNLMMMGPNWIPEKILFSPMSSKFHYFWSMISKATQNGILIVRKKPLKNEYAFG